MRLNGSNIFGKYQLATLLITEVKLIEVNYRGWVRKAKTTRFATDLDWMQLEKMEKVLNEPYNPASE